MRWTWGCKNIAVVMVLAVLMGGAVVAIRARTLDDVARLERIVKSEAVVFSPDTVPDSVANALGEADVLLLGETHYVQEHQVFVAALLTKLHKHGFRLLLIEGIHAYGWMMDDYVTGSLNSLPDEACMMDDYVLRALRAFNQDLPLEERFRVACIDMNHWSSSFQASTRALTADVELPEAMKKVLALDRESEGYLAALEELRHYLEDHAPEYQHAWGETRYGRLRELVDVERETTAISKEGRFFADREAFITKLCERRIAESPGKTVVNIGMYHVQKKGFMGTRQVWLGEHLVRRSAVTRNRRVRCIAFIPIQGLRRDRFNEPNDHPFNLLRTAAPYDLVGLLGRHAGDRMAYLPLAAPLFAEERITVTSTPETTVVVVPKQQFDTFITYPKATVLDSLHQFGPKGDRSGLQE